MAWMDAGEVSDFLQNKGKTVTLHGEPVAVFKTAGEAFFALHNTCLHAGGSLGEGTIKDGCVECPLHGWQYRLESGECVTVPSLSVKSFSVKVERGRVLIDA